MTKTELSPAEEDLVKWLITERAQAKASGDLVRVADIEGTLRNGGIVWTDQAGGITSWKLRQT